MSSFETLSGETPLDDISDLLVKGVRTRRELNKIEAANLRKAIIKYLSRRPSIRTAPFHYTWCLKLHRGMFADVWRWAGTLRITHTNIGFEPAHIEPSLFNLLENLKSWSAFGRPVLEQAVQIHPFLNGNGRWSRMLANIWLKQNRQPVTEWPEEIIGTASVVREEYLAAIRAADRGDLSSLLSLHARFAAIRQSAGIDT